MYDSHAFTVEATRAARWDAAVDHLSFIFDGEPFKLAGAHLAMWQSPNDKVAVERTRSRNNVTVALEMALNVVTVVAEDDWVHKSWKISDVYHDVIMNKIMKYG
ncbi:hypothetical protein Cni_G14069 [Canna indica]|uniref:Uncharacterized protein n=1 Tax=Canna indica TaxID=4628 RepID=A0AAQ3QDB1_9LILI|nr:hypothetical protein Cni_G14069 [Canna indica]